MCQGGAEAQAWEIGEIEGSHRLADKPVCATMSLAVNSELSTRGSEVFMRHD